MTMPRVSRTGVSASGVGFATLTLAWLRHPALVEAHGKWVTHTPVKPFDPTLFTSLNRVNVGLALTAVLLLGVGVFLDTLASGGNVGLRLAAARKRYVPWAPVAVSVGLGLTMLAMAAEGTAWGRELSVPAAMQMAEAVVGVMLVAGLGVGTAGWAVIGLYLATFALFPAIDLVDYLLFVPLALYVIIRGRPRLDLGRWFAHRLGHPAWTNVLARPTWLTDRQTVAVIRIGLGLSLIYFGLNEKWIHPQLAMGVVDNHADAIFEPVQTALGPWVTREMYVFGAGLVEICVGVALTLGALVGPLAVILTLLFGTTALIFGSELFGHLALSGIVVVLLIEGAGSFALPGRLAERIGPRRLGSPAGAPV